MPGRRFAYLLSPQAQADLEEIWLYTFENWSIEQADSYHAAIVAAFAGLASGKKAGRPVDIRDGYFKFPVGFHFVFYRRIGSDLVVVRVLHQRMDASRHL